MLMFLWLILVEKSIVKRRTLEAAMLGWYENNIYEEWN